MRRRPIQLRQELSAQGSPSRRLLIGGLLLLAALAVGATAGVVIAAGSVPASLDASQRPQTAAVTALQFRDPQQASFSMTTAPPQSLRTGASGVLTSFACREGGAFVSGTALFSINGSAVIGLATAVPLWRDIGIGDEGPDVAALQAELARLGHALAVDGYWGWADSDAFADVIAAAGGSQTGSTASLASIAWLPVASVDASTCLVGAGSSVSTGQALADLPVALATAQLTQQPAGAVDGDRVIAIGGEEYAVPAGGVISDPATLTAILGSSPYRQAVSDEDTSDVPYDYLLAQPIAVDSIAPSAIYDIEGDSGCVQHEGVAVRVSIIASQLGLTLVVPSRPLESVDLHPRESTGCR